ncbi:MAG: hypothetical protein ACKVH8_19330, partial [Pirellulales bacterium]
SRLAALLPDDLLPIKLSKISIERIIATMCTPCDKKTKRYYHQGTKTRRKEEKGSRRDARAAEGGEKK